jgi:hypothetical protein
MRRSSRRSSRKSSPVLRRACRPVLSWLEARTLLSGNPTYYTVNLTSNTGASSGTDATTGDPSGDLLWAIEQANASTNPCGSIVDFDPTVFATPQTITLSSTLMLSESAGPEVIQGPGASLLTISGNNSVEVFQVDSGTTASLSALTVTAGSATNGGGINNAGSLTVTDSTVANNNASGNGGGITNAGSLTVADSTVANNNASNSGGGINNSGALTISDGRITGNSATLNGGGINNSGRLTVTDSTIAGNGSYSNGSAFVLRGGGINNSGTLTMLNSTIAGNGAANAGGGIYVGSGALTIANSTIAGNYIYNSGNGGGIYNLGSLTTVNTTIAYNTNLTYSIPQGSGLYDGTGGTATLENTIIANNYNFDFRGISTDIGGMEVSPASSYNLIGSDVSASGGLINGNNGNLVGVNPGLGGLGTNGGLTQTIALLAGSPAIDAGSNALAVDPATGQPLAYDQRGVGFPRIINGTVDIGAFERPSVIGSPTVYTVESTGTTGSGSGNSGDLVYVVNQANANSNLAGSVITFDPAIFNPSTPQIIDLPAPIGLSSPSPEVIQGPGANILTIRTQLYSGGMISVGLGTTATISGLTISGQGSNQVVGITSFFFTNLTVNECDIVDFAGGAILNNEGRCTVENSTIADNGAISGAGITNIGSLTILDSTIADNTAGFSTYYGPATNGGGIDNFRSLTVVNSTIADNHTTDFGVGAGLFDEPGSTATLENTIVAGNTDSGGPDDIAGIALSSASGYNLVGVDETHSLINGNNGNLVGVTDLGLDPNGLQYNGGSTPTIALLAGSPAIGAGSVALTNAYSLTTDQRGAGFPRIVNGTVDIGAVEQSIGPDNPTVYTVTNTSVDAGTVGSLPWAINQANNQGNQGYSPANPYGSRIAFDISTSDPGYNTTTHSWMIVLSSTLVLSQSAGSEEIQGPGPNLLTISGNNAVGVFEVAPGAAALLTGVTIKDGLWNAATDASGSSGGGGIDNFGTLTVTNCMIENNSATSGNGDNGGGIDNEATGIMTVDGSTVEGNSAGFGGGIFNGGVMIATGSSLASNAAGSQGGGIGNSGLLTVSNCTITGNQAGGGGGIFNAKELALSSSTVADNQASNGGGMEGADTGVPYSPSYLMVGNSTIADNVSLGRGGGIDNPQYAALVLVSTTVSGNTADGGGGGVYNEGESSVHDCTISNNSAKDGGGIDAAGTFAPFFNGIQSISDSTIADNSASDKGGGITNATVLTLVNSTLANNSAPTGGGIDNANTLDMLSTTVAYNSSTGPGSGGGLYNEVYGANLYYTVVALNTDNTGADDIGGASVSNTNNFGNLIGTGGSGGLIDGSSGNQVGVANPGLATGLANNGGPTQTIALLAGSPAIVPGVNYNSPFPFLSSYDLFIYGYNYAGDEYAESTDQRLAPRTVNSTVDIGAFEAQQETTTTTVTASPATSVSGQSVTFTATVTPQAGSAIPTATGLIQFEVDGSNFGSPEPLINGTASTAINSLSVGSHTVSAVYESDTADFVASTGSTPLLVEAATSSNIQSVVNDAPSSSGGSVTIQTTSSTAVSTTVQAIDTAAPASPVTVTLDLDGATTTPTTAISAPSSVQVDLISSSGSAIVQGATVTSGTVVIAASVAPVNWTVDGGNVTVEGSASAGDFIVNGGTVTLADGTVITGNSPAITLNSGTVILQGVTAQTATNSPTIIVNGGSLLVRNSTIEESTGYVQAAILINGGTVDLGTTASPGGNIFNINGTGTLIENTTAGPVPAVGDTFENNGAVVASRFGVVSLSTPPAQTANQGVARSFSLGSLTDTVTDSQSWAVDVNWGGNSAHTDFNATSTGPLSAQPHAFATPGTYTVTVTVTDPVGSGVTPWDLVQSFTVTVAPSVFILDPTAGGALSLSGNASINISGGVYVDSGSSSALTASGNAKITAPLIDVHGGVQKSGNATVSPAPTTGAPVVADPLIGLTAPSYSGSPVSENLSGNSKATINPGVYSQITVSGNASLMLDPGIYIIAGGGLSVSGNASVAVSGPTSSLTGTGVMIYNTKSSTGTYGSVTLSGNGAISLTAPTTGTYAGILIFQDRDDAKALTFSGNAMQGMAGVIYAPAAQLAESGNAQMGSSSNPVSIIVDTLTLSGNGVANTVTLSSPYGTVAYAPNQIRDAYGVNNLLGAGLPTPPLDGTGQTIAIVDAYDDPSIFQAVDAFDSQFTLTDSGPTLYAQYGQASSFLTVLNQYGQATSLPSTDPNGPGTDNWEVEEALDVEWAHAIAPGAQIILVEANSQSLSDLMASVATAAAQPGVSVVSMSWGFAEGQAVFASDEAMYDGYFDLPGVTFVASTGDYGAADPEYPAFSPNVVAVGGTSLMLNGDNAYNSETGWGYYSSSAGALIGSGGGLSLYEPEPAYQQGVQSTGYRTTPDVSMVADPATGAWIADTYNLDPSNPFEVVGGTSLSAPAWAGLFALVNQGRAAAGETSLNSVTPTDAQQALYMLPQSDYNSIPSGNNGYTASAGYNLVTGLGTPVANLLVPDLIAYQGAGTVYSGATVGPLQNGGLIDTGAGSGGTSDVFSVFDALTAVGRAADDQAGGSIGIPAPSAALRAGRGAGKGLHAATTRGSSVVVGRIGNPSYDRTLAQGTNPPQTTAVDQVLGTLVDTSSNDSVIGDLAFDQVLSGTHRPKESVVTETAR